jgi:outer membrane protein assembly factor BamD (BamD/ComL family)
MGKTTLDKALIGLLTIGVALAAVLKIKGCGWDYYTDHSVRFNGYRTANEFFRLPRLPNFSRMKQESLFSWGDDDGECEETYEEYEKKLKEIDLTWSAALEGENAGKALEIRKQLHKYLDLTKSMREDRWNGPKELQARRNSAFDKLDALTAIDQGSSEQTVVDYLRARTTYDTRQPAEEVSRFLTSSRADRNLRDNAAYLAAAVSYRDGKNIGVDCFSDVVSEFPKSEKRESALYMSAIVSMKASSSWAADGSDDGGKPWPRDDYWEKARRIFQQLIREYPNGRYKLDSIGWLAHLWLQVGDRPRALADYYRMLASDIETMRAEAVVSLGLIRHKADEPEMATLEQLIANETRTAMAYAYHEIYNYAVWHSCPPRPYWEDCNQERATKELRRIAGFANRMVSTHSKVPLSGGFLLRLAEAQLELQNNKEAARLARRALASGVKGDVRAEALWVAGAGEQSIGQYKSARGALETLVKENPNNRYAEGGRRMLAMLQEDSGDLEGALDTYIALDYRYDVAYFIDVLMTPAQLASFIEKRPLLEHRDELLYALGIRYLRERRWKDAREVLLRIKTVGRGADESYYHRIYNYQARKSLEEDSPKERDFDPTIRGIRPQWIDQDVRTANELELLERDVQLSQGDEKKAEALYQVASYQFERSLLFYNPAAWKGIRHYLLCDLYQDGGFRRPGESQLLFDYMQKHDMASNSLPIFLEVVRRFPNTRAARDALYSAAVCHERLAEYNNYWRRVYSGGGYAGERMVDYDDVRAAYPKYRLPRGTSGWEPSTRTVNGGPGWDQPPKPKPRPSKWARGAELLDKWVNEFTKILNRIVSDIEYTIKTALNAIVSAIAWVFHWIWVLTMCGWLWFLWRRAREARTLMTEALVQCAARPAQERENVRIVSGPTTLFMKLERFFGHDLRDQLREALSEYLYKLRQVGSNRRGRALIGFYAATHGLFAVLIFRLLANL